MPTTVLPAPKKFSDLATGLHPTIITIASISTRMTSTTTVAAKFSKMLIVDPIPIVAGRRSSLCHPHRLGLT